MLTLLTRSWIGAMYRSGHSGVFGPEVQLRSRPLRSAPPRCRESGLGPHPSHIRITKVGLSETEGADEPRGRPLDWTHSGRERLRNASIIAHPVRFPFSTNTHTTPPPPQSSQVQDVEAAPPCVPFPGQSSCSDARGACSTIRVELEVGGQVVCDTGPDISVMVTPPPLQESTRPHEHLQEKVCLRRLASSSWRLARRCIRARLLPATRGWSLWCTFCPAAAGPHLRAMPWPSSARSHTSPSSLFYLREPAC